MLLEGYSQRSGYEPFTATQAQRVPTPFPPPGAGRGWAGEGGRPCPRGWGVYLFAHLLIVPTCSGKEDHLLGYHVGPRSQSSQPPAPSPLPRGEGPRSRCASLQRGCKGLAAGRGWGGCVGSVTHSVPLLLGGGGVAKGMLPCLLVPKKEPAHGLHPRFVVAEITSKRGC